MGQKGQLHLSAVLLIIVFFLELHTLLPLLRDYLVPGLGMLDSAITTTVDKAIGGPALRALQAKDTRRNKEAARQREVEDLQRSVIGLKDTSDEPLDKNGSKDERALLAEKVAVLEKRLQEVESHCSGSE